jgi:hypothetical protein
MGENETLASCPTTFGGETRSCTKNSARPMQDGHERDHRTTPTLRISGVFSLIRHGPGRQQTA